MAAARPQAPALKIPRRPGDRHLSQRDSHQIDYEVLSFAELDAEADAWAARLLSAGVRPGDRSLVMVKPGLPLIASVFALFRIGAIPVIIDPGMRLGAFLQCVERTKPRVLVGIPLAQIVSRVLRKAFRSIEIRVSVSSSLIARLAVDGPPAKISTAPADPRSLAAILFTSGSTGSPKGVRYEHGMFEAQVRLVRETYRIEPGEVDLPLLPVFALFNPALGMTTIVPEVDPRRPAAADPSRIVQAIIQEKVTNSFGSPTLWRIIADHCRAHRLTLPSLKRVLCAGAPVPVSLWADARFLLPNGSLHSPYGATEALPVTTISAAEVPVAPGYQGAPVGRPVPGMQVRVLEITDSDIPFLGDRRELPVGEIGEILVGGPVVTRDYDALPEATRRAKVAAPDGTVWHRMGDCGRLDAEGALWFYGRTVERVETAEGRMFTEPCEQVFRPHASIARCALIGLGERGSQIPAIVVEPRRHLPSSRGQVARELAALARSHPHTASIGRFYFHDQFPVDVRHNAKIHRLTLARWAERSPWYDGDGRLLR
jgi:olefin beta-lactone synthetase